MSTPARPSVARSLTTALLAALGGCTVAPGAEGPDDLGSATAAITAVPGAVRCVVLTLDRGGAGDLAASRLDFPVQAGSAATMSLGPLPAGAVRVSASAYDDDCDALEPATEPSWVGDPTTVTIAPGRRATIALTLRRNVGQSATLDFVEDVATVVAGPSATAAVLQDGTLRWWGYERANPYYGTGVPTPTAVPGVTGARQVRLGNLFWCVLDADGVSCAGDDRRRQLGTAVPNDWSTDLVRTLASTPTATPRRLVAGWDAACVLTEQQTALCWGSIPGLTTVLASPAQLFYGVRFADVALSAANACGVTADGAVYCMGRSDATVDVSRESAITAAAITHDGTTCLLRADGVVRCGGNNAAGAVGNGTTTRAAAPVDVTGLPAVAAITAGTGHVCALGQDGSVWCWGANASGQLGNGTATSALRPTRVPGLAGVVEVSAGATHTCARLRDGSLSCWGSNYYGNVGDGSRVTRFVPARVAW